MTSFSIAAAAPFLLALVPCVFSCAKTDETGIAKFVSQPKLETTAKASHDATPWWKPSALGIDNYS